MNGLKKVESMKKAGSHDLSLARAAVKGKQRARRELVERLLDRVRTMVGYVAGNDRDAEDMVQTTMLEILQGLHGYKASGSLESWADRIAVRTCMRLIKKRSNRAETSFLHEDEGAEPRTLLKKSRGAERDDLECMVESVEKTVSRNRICRRLACLMGGLPAKRRVVITLKWVFDYRLSEIAEMTGTSANTVRDHLQKGKRRFREMLLDDEVLREWLKESTEVSS